MPVSVDSPPSHLVRRIGVPLRMAAGLVLLALVPLAFAAWFISREAASSELDQADAGLTATFGAAVRAFGDVLEDAERRAAELAGSRPVIAALSSRDRRELERLARARENVRFFLGAELIGQRPRKPFVEQDAEAFSDQRSLGNVLVSVPLDTSLVEHLSRTAALALGDRLLIVRGNRIVAGSPLGAAIEPPAGRPGDIQVGRRRYRALADELLSRQGVALVILRDREPIEAAIANARWRGGLTALAALAGVLVLAYLLAPAIARTRFSQQQRAQAARVLAHVNDGVLLLDPEGFVRFWNPAAEAITGLAAGAVSGHPVAEAIPGWPAVADQIPVATQPGELSERAPVQTVPLEVEGNELWLSISGVDFGEGTVYTFYDLTEERRLEELKTDFVASVSHELRTPLASIYGAAVTLAERRELLAHEVRDELLAVIRQQAERLARLINDILLSGQLGAGRATTSEERFDATELVRAVVDEVVARTPTNHTFSLDAARDVPAMTGDEGKVRQVLTNLVENAVKYSPDGGRIEVGLKPGNGHVRFSVRDNGIGIAPAEQARIFERFYRVDPQMRKGIAGTGLGLYICRELVRRMHGRLWVESRVGGGSTFSFELPIACPPQSEEELPRSATDDQRDARPKR